MTSLILYRIISPPNDPKNQTMKITFGGVRGSYRVAANYCVWGHSSDQHTIEIAREANVGRLLLIHHRPIDQTPIWKRSPDVTKVKHFRLISPVKVSRSFGKVAPD